MKKENAKKEKKEVQEKNKNIILAIKYTIPVIVALLIFVGFKIVRSNYRMTVIDLSKYQSVVSSEKQSMVSVTETDCDTCNKTEQLLIKMLQGSNIKTYEIVLDNLYEGELEELMNTLEETKDGITAPTLLIVKDGGLVSKFEGPFDEDLIISYLQDNGLVKKINTGSEENE